MQKTNKRRSQKRMQKTKQKAISKRINNLNSHQTRHENTQWLSGHIWRTHPWNEQDELTKTKGDKDYSYKRGVNTGETNQGRGRQLQRREKNKGRKNGSETRGKRWVQNKTGSAWTQNTEHEHDYIQHTWRDITVLYGMSIWTWYYALLYLCVPLPELLSYHGGGVCVSQWPPGAQLSEAVMPLVGSPMANRSGGRG